MTALIRCRGAASEMASRFGAVPDPALRWGDPVWGGEPIPVVRIEAGPRRLTTARWGLPAHAFAAPVPEKQRGTLYARDLGSAASRLRDPAAFERCLIIVESFAYPEGPSGRCTRSWFGLWDAPFGAWAGLISPADGRCAGLMARANERVRPNSAMMPWLLTPGDEARWLAGSALLALGPAADADSCYRENLGERWATGELEDDARLIPRAFAA